MSFGFHPFPELMIIEDSQPQYQQHIKDFLIKIENKWTKLIEKITKKMMNLKQRQLELLKNAAIQEIQIAKSIVKSHMACIKQNIKKILSKKQLNKTSMETTNVKKLEIPSFGSFKKEYNQNLNNEIFLDIQPEPKKKLRSEDFNKNEYNCSTQIQSPPRTQVNSFSLSIQPLQKSLKKHALNFMSEEEIMQLNQPDFEWCASLHHQNIVVRGKFATNKTPTQATVLMTPKLTFDDRKTVILSFVIPPLSFANVQFINWKIRGLNDLTLGMKWGNNNGNYILGSNGKIFTHEVSDNDKKQAGFVIKTDDRIALTWLGPQRKFLVTNLTLQQQYQFDIGFQDDQYLCFGVCIAQAGAEIVK